MKIASFDRGVLAALALVACLSVAVPAQEPEESPSSLGDIARQSRSQHTAPDTKSNKAQDLVDEMQAEQEASDNAPLGYKNYDAGDYRLFVPFPYSLEGRDNGGAVLLGSKMGVTNSEVLAGAPLPLPSTLNDIGVANFMRRIAQQYSSSTVLFAGQKRFAQCVSLLHEQWQLAGPSNHRQHGNHCRIGPGDSGDVRQPR